MALLQRDSPKNKRVSLFVTCMVDMLYPDTGMAVVDVLEHLGVQVDFPTNQTCCGQPGFNSGYRNEAREVARQFLRAFADAEVIVTPSGSCAAMVRHEYPALFAEHPDDYDRAVHMASITWEFTEFLIDGLGISDIKGRMPESRKFAFHDACHGLRLLGIGDAGRKLIANIDNVTLEELNECDVCCGFGGLFSVKMADVSGSVLDRKIENINSCDATVLTGDVSCMTHMNGGLARQNSSQRVEHIANILAESIRTYKEIP